MIGFTKTIAREGAKYNIIVNAVAPSAGTNMTRTVWAEEQVGQIKPEFVAPLIAALCSEKPPVAGQLFEAGSGSFKHTRWQRARGVDFDFTKGVPAVEEVAKAFGEIVNFDNGKADNPDAPQEGSKYTMGNVLKNPRMVSVAIQYRVLCANSIAAKSNGTREPCKQKMAIPDRRGETVKGRTNNIQLHQTRLYSIQSRCWCKADRSGPCL